MQLTLQIFFACFSYIEKKTKAAYEITLLFARVLVCPNNFLAQIFIKLGMYITPTASVV
jgi:hypothetical protein